MSFWDFLWLLIWSYLFVAYLVVLFHIAADVSETLNSAGSRRRCGLSG
jgi:hypothetical protein